ncbi:MAG TPA: gamma-glutamyltransferase, partial [candidate division Zixibacteria bacterium]|nr:gamma-glutamyltransferase [candidate division Zixibacteria bacterium]
ARRRGYRATTVPTTPATLAYALERFGTFSLARALEPAIALAENGVVVSQLLSSLMAREAKHLRRFTGGSVFLKDGRPYRPGDTLTQPALADTLRRLARNGVKSFYSGQIARVIHDDMSRNDGLLQRDDLARTPWPLERRPVVTRFQGRRVVTFPPPGAGRALIEILNILEHFTDKQREFDTPDGALALAAAIQQAARDRQDRPFDPNFYQQVTGRHMLSSKFAKQRAGEIRKRIQTQGETTHLSVFDKDGSVVALTQSIERVFGSCVVTPELGFLYNNYMSAFEYEDISHPYYMRPNAAPWASVAPTIVYRGKRPWLALGSPGSERIVSTVAQVLLRLNNHTPFDAVAAPRLHCSLEGVVSLEASRFRNDVPLALERVGFTIDRREPLSFYLGCVQLAMRERHGFVGVADPRRDGSAEGPVR